MTHPRVPSPGNTERLAFYDLSKDDLPDLRVILQDPETMAAWEGAFSDAEVEAWLDRILRQYDTDGYSFWGVVQRGTSRFVGQVGIINQEIDGRKVPEVGYLLNRKFWHRGFATEAAIACVDWAFENLDCSEVWVQIRDTNIASMNVAIRLGMTIRFRFVKHYKGVDMPHYAFAVHKSDWV